MKSLMPKINSVYNDKEYWNERYQEDDKAYDWFLDYSKVKKLINKYVLRNSTILNLGCGNSNFPFEMAEDGYRNIINIDYSPVVIEAMENKTRSIYDYNFKDSCLKNSINHQKDSNSNKNHDGISSPEEIHNFKNNSFMNHTPSFSNNAIPLKWKVLDIMDMSCFEDEIFEVIIEKGTLDSLLVTEKNPWLYSKEKEIMLDRILSEISRILKCGGVFISITFCQPHFRLPFYAKHEYNWNIDTEIIECGLHYFFYILKKGEKLSKPVLKYRTDYLTREENFNCSLLNIHKKLDYLTSDDDEDYLMKGIEIFE